MKGTVDEKDLNRVLNINCPNHTCDNMLRIAVKDMQEGYKHICPACGTVFIYKDGKAKRI